MTEEIKRYNQTVGQAAESLRSDPENGLAPEEAGARLRQYGYNRLESKKKTTFLVRFLRQFKDFMIIVLILAAVISGVIGLLEGEGVLDSAIILVIVIFNSFIGAVQESKAEQSLEALKKMSAQTAKVVRGGRLSVEPAEELVPGDIVMLETGDVVPADLRIIEAVNLKAQEAALTGESVPVDKHSEPLQKEDIVAGERTNMLFSSTIVTYGRGKGIVTDTGMNTEVGKIAGIINTAAETQTPLQQKLNNLGKTLGIGVLAICAVIFLINMIRARFAPEAIVDTFMAAVSLAVAAIPEGLPAVATLVLAFGVQRMVKKNAIIKNLPSVETLGSATVICSDKTGTLTQNRMTVEKIYTDGKLTDVSEITSPEAGQIELIRAAMLCNDSKLADDDSGVYKGDPTETALMDMGVTLGTEPDKIFMRRVAEIPFDSDRKLMTTVHEHAGTYYIFTKGAVDELLKIAFKISIRGEITALVPETRASIEETNRTMAQLALRVLAMGYKTMDHHPTPEEMRTLESDLIYLGMVGMIDPARPECQEAVAKCRSAGIKPVMITGDHKITATAIASTLGILTEGEEALTGAELDKISDEELSRRAPGVSVYARVSPEHKVRIVKAWQADGAIVSMTGDGVNDAPALKTADIGVAMGITGTDVAKQAADVVLTDDNFATIVSSVEEGRRIYDNILKAIQFLLSGNIGEVIVLFLASLLGWAAPLLPVHILWINLVTDSLPALALSFEPAEGDVMKRKPRRSGTLFTPALLWRIIYQGIMVGGLTLAAFRIGSVTSPEAGRTMAFCVLAFSELVHVYNIRSRKSVVHTSPFSNTKLVLGIAVSAAIMAIVLILPAFRTMFEISALSGSNILITALLSLAPLPIVEIFKLLGINGKDKD